MTSTARRPHPPRRRRALLGVRAKLTLSYAGFLMIVAAVLLGAVALFLLRYVPEEYVSIATGPHAGYGAPNRSMLLQAFLPRALQALGLCLVIGLVGGWFLAGRMLRPLKALDAAAREVAGGTLTHRIDHRGPRDEFGLLAEAFDDMTARVEDMVQRQERFAANASHELRTPLAASRALLENAIAQEPEDVQDTLRRLHAIIVRAGETSEALLLLSRISREMPREDRVDLSLSAEDAAETLYVLAAARRVELQVTGEQALTIGSAPLIRQLVPNLVANAIMHNEPQGGWVRIRTGTRGDRAVLRVENSGETVTEAMLPRLLEPFQRGGGRARGEDDAGAGAGLGLSVVHAITEVHGARLDLVPRPGGGLEVEVSFPAST